MSRPPDKKKPARVVSNKDKFFDMREECAAIEQVKRRRFTPWDGKNEPTFEVETPWDGKL